MLVRKWPDFTRIGERPNWPKSELKSILTDSMLPKFTNDKKERIKLNKK